MPVDRTISGVMCSEDDVITLVSASEVIRAEVRLSGFGSGRDT
jgi:hypothetical protein